MATNMAEQTLAIAKTNLVELHKVNPSLLHEGVLQSCLNCLGGSDNIAGWQPGEDAQMERSLEEKSEGLLTTIKEKLMELRELELPAWLHPEIIPLVLDFLPDGARSDAINAWAREPAIFPPQNPRGLAAAPAPAPAIVPAPLPANPQQRARAKKSSHFKEQHPTPAGVDCEIWDRIYNSADSSWRKDPRCKDKSNDFVNNFRQGKRTSGATRAVAWTILKEQIVDGEVIPGPGYLGHD